MEGVYLCLIAYGIVVVEDAHEKCIMHAQFMQFFSET